MFATGQEAVPGARLDMPEWLENALIIIVVSVIVGALLAVTMHRR
jgi:hypothetical protein